MTQGGRTPARSIQATQAGEQSLIDEAIIVRADQRVGRVRVDRELAIGVAADQELDVVLGDGVDLFILGVGIDIQPVVEKVGADQTRDALGQRIAG